MKKYRFDDAEFTGRAERLIREKRMDEARELLYEAIVEDQEYTVADIVSVPALAPGKLNKLNKFIALYTRLEQYEKNVPLRDIIAKAKSILGITEPV